MGNYQGREGAGRVGGEREEIAGKKARLMEKADLIRGNGREASPISTYRLGRIRIGEFVQFEAANILLASREKTGKLFPGAPRDNITVQTETKEQITFPRMANTGSRPEISEPPSRDDHRARSRDS